jgi:glycosyltransferase involved in cell wall biosynthesis
VDALRIALVHASDVGRGAEACVLSLHRSLRRLGHDSTLYVGDCQSDEPGVVEIPYVRGLPGSRRASRWLERSFGLQDIYNPSFRALRHMLRERADVVHFNSLWGSGGFADIGAVPAISRAVPSILTMHENWLITGHCACFHACERWRSGCGACPDLKTVPALPRDGTRWNWNRKRRSMSRSRLRIVAVSEWLRAKAELSPILVGKEVSCIYNGIDLTTFAPAADAASREKARAELGLEPGEVAVLVAGQTVEGIHQGIASRHAIAAINGLSAEQRVRPLVIGNSAARFAQELQRSAIVLPFQSSTLATARLYRAADLCLVTSEFETFGRVAAEAQACGTPVVAFATGGIPEVVPHEAGGFLAPPGDVPTLLSGLRRFVASAELRQSQATLALAHVRGKFDEEDVARQYLELYRDAIREAA